MARCRLILGVAFLLLGAIPAGADWEQITKLLASDGASDDRFGFPVSIDGDVAIVGARLHDHLESNAGAAYIFRRVDGSWVQEAELLASDGAPADQFGRSAAISGNTAVVSAYFDDDRGTDSGSVYIFRNIAGEWVEIAKLTASDGSPGDHFGRSVSISGDTIIVGAYLDDARGTDSGSAYIFREINGEWVQEAKLVPADGSPHDRLGWSASISGDTAIVGAYADDDLGSASGSAYIFRKVDGEWTQEAKLLPDDGASGDQFGLTVAISADTAIIGSRYHDDHGSDAGAAYVFERVGDSWLQRAELAASDGIAGQNFGSRVAIHGDRAVVSASFDNELGSQAGSAYVFEKVEGQWQQMAKLLADDGAGGDRFGVWVSISDETIIIGAAENDDLGVSSGSAYIFQNGPPPCPPDLDGDGDGDADDFFAYLDAFERGDASVCDLDGDGDCDSNDFFGYLGLLALGC